jgi:hypothetical protein
VLTVSVVFGVAIAQTATPNSKADTQQQAKQESSKMNSQSDAVKTMSYKGVLVDMSCDSHSSASAPAAESGKANSANRAASDSGTSCPVTANSSALGMKLADGKTVRFDMVGNQRAQDELKNNKRWTKQVSDGQPIHATVSGVINGDKVIVMSIH